MPLFKKKDASLRFRYAWLAANTLRTLTDEEMEPLSRIIYPKDKDRLKRTRRFLMDFDVFSTEIIELMDVAEFRKPLREIRLEVPLEGGHAFPEDESASDDTDALIGTVEGTKPE